MAQVTNARDMSLRGRSIVVGVTAGIAAYKVADLVRRLVKADVFTRVAMTANATRFVAPLTFEALSGNCVMSDMWGRGADTIAHIDWGQSADLIIIAPATANFIAKMAAGIADDFLSTMVLAATAPILLCPSMNTRMFQSSIVQENLERLRRRGLAVMAPGEGSLACGTEGAGRLPEPEDVLEEVWYLLLPKDLKGLKVLVTAGPTCEPMDPVRFISNRSSGRMGYALARAARQRGAEVVLVSGPTELAVPAGVERVLVTTAREMHQAVFAHCAGCHIIIKAAAVSDYRPQEQALQKIKKGAETLTLAMVKNPDILQELGHAKGPGGPVLVGFAAETEDLLVHARDKLAQKRLDMIVANDVSSTDAGFRTITNRIKMIFPDGVVEDSGLVSKDTAAHMIIDRAKGLVGSERCGGTK